MTRRQRLIMVGGFGLFAILFAAAAVLLAVLDMHARSDANAYNAAPVCSAGGPTTGPTAPSGCKQVVPALIGAVTVRTGRSPTTMVTLTVAGGPSDYTTIVSGKAAGAFVVGEPVTVTLWRNSVAQISDSACGLTTQDNPNWSAGNDAVGVFVLLIFTAVCARMTGWAIFRERVVSRRFALADLTAVLLIAAVGVLYLTHAVTAALYLTAITVAVFAASVTVWPTLSFVRRPDPFSQSEQPSDAVTL